MPDPDLDNMTDEELQAYLVEQGVEIKEGAADVEAGTDEEKQQLETDKQQTPDLAKENEELKTQLESLKSELANSNQSTVNQILALKRQQEELGRSQQWLHQNQPRPQPQTVQDQANQMIDDRLQQSPLLGQVYQGLQMVAIRQDADDFVVQMLDDPQQGADFKTLLPEIRQTLRERQLPYARQTIANVYQEVWNRRKPELMKAQEERQAAAQKRQQQLEQRASMAGGGTRGTKPGKAIDPDKLRLEVEGKNWNQTIDYFVEQGHMSAKDAAQMRNMD